METNYWKTLTVSTLLLIALIRPVSPKEQYVEPLLFGMKVNISYDIANLFNRYPIQGGLSLLLGIGLAGILFFGVITAPFGYMFGVPSEKYVMGDFIKKLPGREEAEAKERIMYLTPPPIASPRSFLLDYVRSEKSSPRTIFSDQRRTEQKDEECCSTFLHYFDVIVGYLEYWEPGFLEKWKSSLSVLRKRLGGRVGTEIVNTVESTLNLEYSPEFLSSIFYLIPEKEADIRNQVCQQRMICHAHGALPYFPEAILKVYHKFSKKLAKIPVEYVEAMKIGITNETLCAEVYSECYDNAFTLTMKSYLSLLPDKTQINGMPRRKQKMYQNKMNVFNL